VISKEEHVKHWVAQAEDDWEAVNILFKGKKYLQSLFFTHLVIEKLAKALWIKYNESNVPPKTHNVLYIMSQTPVKLDEKTNEFILNLNRFQIEGRYQEYLNQLSKICNEEFTNAVIIQAKELKTWLIEKMQ
jgi:HEPN domain-containing protein